MYSVTCQTSEIELFARTINEFALKTMLERKANDFFHLRSWEGCYWLHIIPDSCPIAVFQLFCTMFEAQNIFHLIPTFSSTRNQIAN